MEIFYKYRKNMTLTSFNYNNLEYDNLFSIFAYSINTLH